MSEILYNRIGSNYNTTRKADDYIASRIYHLLQGNSYKHYLDIGCGTGNYTIALSNLGLRFTGIDPSDTMLQVAKSKNNHISWKHGVAEQLPFDDHTFDGAIATLTIHHWTNILAGFKEINRVLKENSLLVIFTTLPEQTAAYWLSHYFPEMIKKSVAQLPSMVSVENALHTAGFTLLASEKYFMQNNLKDQFLNIGKNKPELYFDDNIRNGISSFANLSNPAEVQQGLSMLQTDIENGTFEKVKRQYENDLGDYLFLTVQKVS